jgi:hypothetical protein
MDQNQNNQAMQGGQAKDPNVYSFMLQMVQEKNGDEVDNEFLNTEAERLYLEFGDKLVESFEPLLSDEQRTQFDQMVEQGATQDAILNFLTTNIQNLEQKILDVLMLFKQQYVAEKE